MFQEEEDILCLPHTLKKIVAWVGLARQNSGAEDDFGGEEDEEGKGGAKNQLVKVEKGRVLFSRVIQHKKNNSINNYMLTISLLIILLNAGRYFNNLFCIFVYIFKLNEKVLHSLPLNTDAVLSTLRGTRSLI